MKSKNLLLLPNCQSRLIFKIMHPFRFIPLLIVSTTFVSQTAISQMRSWNLAMNRDGIAVYIRGGPDNSPVDEFKGIMEMKTKVAALCSVMNLFSAYPSWFYNCKLGKNICKVNDKEGYAYIIYHIPFPFDDRDLIIHYKLTQQKDRTVIIGIEGEPRFKREKKDFVRVYKASGHWRFTPKDNGLVEIEYQLHMEPGGNLPAWLSNKYLPDIPYQTLLKLREEVKKPQHMSVSIKWLR